MIGSAQTPQDMKRMTLGMIASVSSNIAQCAMEQDEENMRQHFWCLKSQMELLETINDLLAISQ